MTVRNGPSTTVHQLKGWGHADKDLLAALARVCFGRTRRVCPPPRAATASARAAPRSPSWPWMVRRERFRARQHHVGNEDGPAGRADRREPPSARHHLDDGIVGAGRRARPRASATPATTTWWIASSATAQRHRCDLPRGLRWSGRMVPLAGGAVRCYSGDSIYTPNATGSSSRAMSTEGPGPHNHNVLETLVRRSLPICSRGARTNPNLEQLIDGPPEFDRCNRPTPSAPVWVLAGSECGARCASASPRWRVWVWSSVCQEFGRFRDVVSDHAFPIARAVAARAQSATSSLRCSRSGVPKYQTLLSDDRARRFQLPA